MHCELTPEMRQILGLPTEAEEERQREATNAEFAARINALAERVDEIERSRGVSSGAEAGSTAYDGEGTRDEARTRAILKAAGLDYDELAREGADLARELYERAKRP